MDNERLRQAFRLFDQLLDAPAETWEPQLLLLCPDDAQVRAEALALLQADAWTDGVTGLAGRAPDLLSDVAQAQESSANARLIGQRVGPWRLMRELGRGGMGAVWLAERADGAFEQQVAIKLIRPGWDADEVIGRFRAERQILAGLNHPHIARLVDGGVTDDGKPWLALEYVDGVNLRSYCEARALPVAARLKLLLIVCEAVAYAHARLIVHRDLKPSNILATSNGTVKLLDFGIAKLLDSEGAAATGTRLFTPEYAAPEQVRGDPVTTAVDIYALGLLAYELLTGTSPYRPEHTTSAAYERAVLEQEPTRPSQVTRRRGEANPVAMLQGALRGDLDAIVLKALRKEPEQRYASVNAFAADVQAYLEQRPVAARRGGRRYRMQRFVRRHAIVVGLGAATIFALALGLGAALWQRDVARSERDRAETEAESARRTADFLRGVFEHADPDKRPGETVTAKQLLDEGERSIRADAALQPDVRATLLETLGRSRYALGDMLAARSLLEEAVRLREAGNERNAEAIAHVDLALTLSALDRFDEAFSHTQIALAIADRSTRAGQEAYAEALSEVGILQINTRKQPKAIETLGAAFALKQELYDLDDERMLKTLIPLVYVLSWEDRAPEAFALINPLWSKVAAVTKPGDMKRRRLIATQTDILQMLGRYDEAVPLARENYEVKERIYGHDHRDVRSAQYSYAKALYYAGRPAETLPLYVDLIAMTRAQKIDIEIGPTFAFPLRDYALALDAVGRAEEAILLLEEAIEVRSRERPRSEYLAADTIYLAIAERHAGRFDAAERHLDQASSLTDKQAHESYVPERLGIERVWLALARGQTPPDCSAAEHAERRRASSSDLTALAEAQAALTACRILIGQAEAAAGFVPALTTARATGRATPREREAIERALALWQHAVETRR